MSVHEGDVIRAPGIKRTDAAPTTEILYSTVGLLQKGGTIKPNTGVYPAGQALKYDSATKRYEKATVNADVVGFLRLPLNSGGADDIPKQGVIVFGGVIRAAAVVGVTANATLAGVLGGSFNAERQFLKF